MNEMLSESQEARTGPPITRSDSKSRWKRAVASALSGVSIACVLIGALTTAQSIRVDRLGLYSGGSGGDDMALFLTDLAQFGGVVLAFVGLSLGFASLVVLRTAGAKPLAGFKWGVIGTTGCAVIIAYNLCCAST
jgi:hypothetical protein